MSTASHRAYEEIRRRISSGEYQAGLRLREEELSSTIGVSRTPIREALRRLDAEGVVVNVPNRGAHVASWSDSELTDIFEMRALLECYAARRASSRMSTESIDQMATLADAMDACLDDLPADQVYARIAELNNEFHELIMVAAGSPLLRTLTMATVHVPLVHRTFQRYSRRGLERSFAHHRELIEAFRVQDGVWAESVMRSHILAARHIFDSALVETSDGEETDSVYTAVDYAHGMP